MISKYIHKTQQGHVTIDIWAVLDDIHLLDLIECDKLLAEYDFSEFRHNWYDNLMSFFFCSEECYSRVENIKYILNKNLGVDIVIKLKEVVEQFKKQCWQFFENKSCKYYPCHDLKEINCLFCFCPLYHTECGGTYKILDNGKKDCSECGFPHKKENYHLIIQKLKELYA